MEDPHSSRLSCFVSLLGGLKAPRILEVGTMRSEPDRPTHHREWSPAARWVFLDMQAGQDVEVVGNVERLPFANASFDAFVACSTWEHVQRPWVATLEVARVLKPGGWMYVQSHQSFPIHGYPSDYWRFTDQAFRLLAEDAGLTVLDVGYEFECQVVSEADPGGRFVQAFLNVDMVCER